MTFEHIIKLARADARSRFNADGGMQSHDPVAALTGAMQTMGEDAKPFWMYDEKKNDPTRSDVSWGPSTPLNSGDAAERNGPFAAGMNIVFGGV